MKRLLLQSFIKIFTLVILYLIILSSCSFSDISNETDEPQDTRLFNCYASWTYSTRFLKVSDNSLIINTDEISMNGSVIFPAAGTGFTSQKLGMQTGQIWIKAKAGKSEQKVYLYDYFIQDSGSYGVEILWLKPDSSSNATLLSAPNPINALGLGIQCYIKMGNTPNPPDSHYFNRDIIDYPSQNDVFTIDSYGRLVLIAGSSIKTYSLDGSPSTVYTIPDTVYAASFHKNGKLYAYTGSMDIKIYDNTLTCVKTISNPILYVQSSIAADSLGNIYIPDLYGNCVLKYNSDGNYVGKIGSKGTGDGQFNFKTGVASGNLLATDDQNNLYVIDYGDNSRVEKFDVNGVFIKSWPVDLASGIFIGSNGRVNIAARNKVYITDKDGNQISKFNAMASSFIVTDANDNIYISNYWSKVISKYLKTIE